ncbi:MAG: sugar transferase [Clostridia bacterium]
MYKKRSNTWTKHFDFILIVEIILAISYFTANLIVYNLFKLQSIPFDINNFIIVMLFSLVLIFLNNTFHGVLNRTNLEELKHVVASDLLIFLVALLHLFIGDNEFYIFEAAIIGFTLYLVLAYVSIYLRKIFLLKMVNRNKKSIMIITTRDLVDRVIENIKNDKYSGYIVNGVGLIDDCDEEKVIEGTKVIVSMDNIIEYICREWVDEVFINISSTDTLAEETMKKFQEMGITVHFRLFHDSEMKNASQFVEKLGNYTVLTTTIKTISLKEQLVKRFVDILAGLTGCIIAGILFLVLAPMIYIKSPGPILFSQIRIGQNGRKFKIYKFRSMYLDAEQRKSELMAQNQVKDGMMFKVKWDTRIIGSEKGPDKGIGNFIRKYSLDEWPQFYNILKGDMSLIGTRPPTTDEWVKYELHHRIRLAIKPGLTGMWQVSGRSKIQDFEEVVKLDKKYITDWSLGLDFKIIFKTILVVLKKDGAL